MHYALFCLIFLFLFTLDHKRSRYSFPILFDGEVFFRKLIGAAIARVNM